jgi:hypothetical protein
MLSYLTPSDSALVMCSTSSDEGNKSLYPTEGESDELFNSSRIPYSYTQHHKSPIPFVYGSTSAPTYGFGFNFYDDMSSFTGKYSMRVYFGLIEILIE